VTRLFSLRPLPWQPPLELTPAPYTGKDWRACLPVETPTPCFDAEVRRLMHGEIPDELATAAALAAAPEEWWDWLLRRWDALREHQRQHILAQPGCIPNTHERQVWLSRLRAARRRIVEVQFRPQRIIPAIQEDEPGCDVWLEGVVRRDARRYLHPDRRVPIAVVSLLVQVERSRRNTLARLLEPIEIQVAIPVEHPDLPNLIRRGNRVTVEGMLERVVVPLRGDDPAHTLRVEQTVQRVGGKLVLTQPKTASSKRTLPLPNKVERVLARHAERQAEERLRDDWEDYGLVFPSERGTPLYASLCGKRGRLATWLAT
jgi:hypothetical protein